ncbi:MAG TPA: ribosome silencing factor [Thermoleophilia bacterium]|nr:ribosome silencing factor [Thermoleophilia bacterium]HQG04253.1 ribosome silencing factor [Thermoleophilia bacterium]HQG54700.1 ribosome silencing factor [Thermoleophilia bacterium]HQJ96934.1 ribosome silencing factor [Thermoleophilia bacterium]
MRDLALEIAGFAAGKKAKDVVVLEMAAAVTYTDYFVIATGATTRQTRAIVDEILTRLRHRLRPARIEGERDGDWILLDYLDVVVHVFTPAAREFYRLENLWGDVPRVPFDAGD